MAAETFNPLKDAVPDYSGFVEDLPKEMPEEQAKHLSLLVDRQLMLEAKKSQAEQLLKETTKALDLVQQFLLPELLEQMGLTEIRTAEGAHIKVDSTIRASLAAAKNPERARQAIDWLIEHGHGNVVKDQVILPFAAGQSELVAAVLDELKLVNDRLGEKNEAWSIDVQEKMDVHPSTLSSLISSLLKDGEEVPHDLFGVIRQKKAMIKVE